MKREIDYKLTLEEAKQIAKAYCEQNGYSYEKLLTFQTEYSAPMPSRNDCWLWYKPYEGPLVDENGYIMDLQTMPDFIMAVYYDGRVAEADHIDLIKP